MSPGARRNGPAAAGDERPAEPAATVRGDIQRGLSGDKIPGFDPAMAPMETDGEAGGAAMTGEQVQAARETQRAPNRFDNQGSYANAMRAGSDEDVRSSSTNVMIGVALVVLATLIFLISLLG